MIYCKELLSSTPSPELSNDRLSQIHNQIDESYVTSLIINLYFPDPRDYMKLEQQFTIA